MNSNLVETIFTSPQIAHVNQFPFLSVMVSRHFHDVTIVHIQESYYMHSLSKENIQTLSVNIYFLSPRMTNSPLKVFTIIIFSLFLLISSIISIFNLDKVYSAPVLWPFLTIEALSQHRWPRSLLYCTILTQEPACMMRVKREFQGPLIDTASTPLIYWYTRNTLIHYGHTQKYNGKLTLQ